MHEIPPSPVGTSHHLGTKQVFPSRAMEGKWGCSVLSPTVRCTVSDGCFLTARAKVSAAAGAQEEIKVVHVKKKNMRTFPNRFLCPSPFTRTLSHLPKLVGLYYMSCHTPLLYRSPVNRAVFCFNYCEQCNLYSRFPSIFCIVCFCNLCVFICPPVSARTSIRETLNFTPIPICSHDILGKN